MNFAIRQCVLVVASDSGETGVHKTTHGGADAAARLRERGTLGVRPARAPGHARLARFARASAAPPRHLCAGRDPSGADRRLRQRAGGGEHHHPGGRARARSVRNRVAADGLCDDKRQHQFAADQVPAAIRAAPVCDAVHRHLCRGDLRAPVRPRLRLGDRGARRERPGGGAALHLRAILFHAGGAREMAPARDRARHRRAAMRHPAGAAVLARAAGDEPVADAVPVRARARRAQPRRGDGVPAAAHHAPARVREARFRHLRALRRGDGAVRRGARAGAVRVVDRGALDRLGAARRDPDARRRPGDRASPRQSAGWAAPTSCASRW
jgi:hypothetical protein